MGGPSQDQGREETSPGPGGFVDAVQELYAFSTKESRDALIPELIRELEEKYLGETHDGLPLVNRYDQLQKFLGVGTPSSAFRPDSASPVRESVHRDQAPVPPPATRMQGRTRNFPSREELSDPAARSAMIDQIQDLSQKFEDLSNVVFKLYSDAGGDLSAPASRSSTTLGSTRGLGQSQGDGRLQGEGGSRVIGDEQLRALLLDVKKLKEQNTELVKMVKEYRLREEKYQQEVSILERALKKEREDHLKLQRSHKILEEKAIKIHDYYTQLTQKFETLKQDLTRTAAENDQLLKIAAAAQRKSASRYMDQSQAAPRPSNPKNMLGGVTPEDIARSGATIASVWVGKEAVDHFVPNNNGFSAGAGVVLAIGVYCLLEKLQNKR